MATNEISWTALLKRLVQGIPAFAAVAPRALAADHADDVAAILTDQRTQQAEVKASERHQHRDRGQLSSFRLLQLLGLNCPNDDWQTDQTAAEQKQSPENSSTHAAHRADADSECQSA